MSKLGIFYKKLGPASKVLAAVAVFGLIYGAKWLIVDSGVFPKSVKESFVPKVDNLPPLAYDKNATAPEAPIPSSKLFEGGSQEIRVGVMGWNAQTGLMFANGGAQTTENSFMAKQKLNIHLICQNDCNKQAEGLMAFAQEYSSGSANTNKGYHMIAWMGDGVPAYISGLNERIKKSIGEQYTAQVFFAAGSSFGEDKFMGKIDWKRNPQSARGSLIVGVLKDGDWNIAMKWFSDNDVPVNNDPTTYDPNAVNWMNADDYIKASEKYIEQPIEKRAIVINKKRVGRDTTITPTGLVTWTPGDVTAVQKRGGLVTIASTKEYSAQMPCVFIGIKKWMQENRKAVESFILATCLGGDQVKSHNSALQFASTVSATVYGDENMKPADWEKYYRGFEETDQQGNIVELGGSRVWNLADNAEYFGLNGGANKYEAVYKTFGDLVSKAYPEDVKSYPPINEVVDLSYLKNVYANNKNNSQMTVASTPNFKENSTMSQLVSKKTVTIEFEFGSATIKPSAIPLLKQIANDITIADNLLVSIEGHTDNIGNPESNLTLSNARANAIKQWLLSYDSKTFQNRITAIGYGAEKPIADNSTDAGRAKNRRVEIKLGK